MYIAEVLSKKFANKGIDYEDIYQVACLGLIYAVERFDPEEGTKFATFATPTVAGEIKRYFRDKGSYIRVPRQLYNIFIKAEKIRRGGGELSNEEISRILNIPVSTLETALSMGNYAFVKSLEEAAGFDTALMDTIGADDKSFLMIEDKDFVDYCFSQLTPRERDFVKMRYFEEMTQKEIAEKWDTSQMYASRLEKKVLKKIKDMYFKD